MAERTVRVNLEGFARFRRRVADALRTPGGANEIRRVFKQWAEKYRTFVQERFDRLSKGGGGGKWPPLKKSTIARRRKGKAKKIRIAKTTGKRDRRFKKQVPLGAVAILRDTNILFAAVDSVFRSRPGQLEKDIINGIRVGYGGPARHPGSRKTIADIARFHQRGAGNLPKREIIVKPDGHTLALMINDMERGLERLARRG